VIFKQGHELITTGPYRFVRHPIYTSILALLLGTAIAAGRLASLLAMLFFFAGFWIKLKQEETLMVGHFPEEYPAYQARVKALAPFVF
jgi:protein-S-isoprenylcysteine O-methyltransferase Ste14